MAFPFHVVATTVLGLFAVLFLAVRLLLWLPAHPEPRVTDGDRVVVAAHQRDAWRAIAIFIITLFLCIAASFLSLVAIMNWGLDDPQETWLVMAQSIWIFSPIVSALAGRFGPDIVSHVRRKMFGPVVPDPNEPSTYDRSWFLQFRFSWAAQWRPMLLAYLLPAAAGTWAFFLLLVFPLADSIVDKEFVRDVAAVRLGLQEFPYPIQLVVYIGYAVFLGPVWDVTCPPDTDFGSSAGGPAIGTSWLLLAFCEEFGWAGLLFPAARRAITGDRSFVLSWLLTSTIWVSWHVPYIVAGGECCNGTIPEVVTYEPSAPGTPLWWTLLGFTLDLFLARFCMCILTETNRAGILPAVLFHAGHNMFVESIIQLLKPKQGFRQVYGIIYGESGLFQILAYVWAAFMLYRWRWHRVRQGDRLLRADSVSLDVQQLVTVASPEAAGFSLREADPVFESVDRPSHAATDAVRPL